MSKPQRQHILNLIDALLVCEDEKTLAAFQRQFIKAPGASNMDDSLRISPCTVRIGKRVPTVDLWLYLRENNVRRLNRHKKPEQHIPFHSKNSLAKSILEALHPLLPKGWAICVQFDSWYASEQFIKYVRRQGWHVTCGLKHNRKLNGKRIDQIATALRHRRYTHIQVTAADGNPTPYYKRQTTGRLQKVPFEVRVTFSKQHPREQSPAYFMSMDLTRSAHIKT